jgi:Type II CAAX prenyl endopeptidase Rce1-like
MLARVVLFAGLTHALLWRCIPRAPVPDPADRRRDRAARATIGGVLVATCFLAVRSPMAAVGLTAVVVEESVFRWRLPQAMRASASEACPRTLAVFASQIAFAASHLLVLRSPDVATMTLLFVQLLAAGCFLAILAEQARLGTSIAVHGLTNYLILSARVGYFTMPAPSVLGVSLVAGVLILIASIRHGRPSPASPPGM